MADSKITALTALTAADPANDMMPIVDVSDTSMAASGTTKRISINNILACSPAATLASATITGDLTVDTSTLKVDSANNRVGIGTATPSYPLDLSGDLAVNGNENYVYLFSNYSIGNNSRVRFRAVGAGGGSGYGGDFRISTRATNNTWNTDVLTIDSSANCIWTDGAGGTRMTLNSTGLGVGVSPSNKMTVRVAPASGGADGLSVNTGTYEGSIFITGSAYNNYGVGANTAWLYSAANNLAIGPYGSGVVQIVTNGSERMRIDSSGNVGVGVTPSAWNSNYNAIDIGQNGTIAGRAGSSNTVDIASNGFRNTSGNWVYKLATSNTACRYQIDGSTGSHIWYTGAAGTAGNTISGFSSALMTLDASGNLIWSPASSPPSLATNGQLTVNATSNTNLRFSYRGSDGVTRVANLTLA